MIIIMIKIIQTSTAGPSRTPELGGGIGTANEKNTVYKKHIQSQHYAEWVIPRNKETTG